MMKVSISTKYFAISCNGKVLVNTDRLLDVSSSRQRSKNWHNYQQTRPKIIGGFNAVVIGLSIGFREVTHFSIIINYDQLDDQLGSKRIRNSFSCKHQKTIKLAMAIW